MQVRLTEQGLTSVSAIAPALFGSFLGSGIPVPTSTQNLGVGKAIICPSGSCTLNVTLSTTPPGMALSFQPTNRIHAIARIVVVGDIPMQACIGSCSDSCGGTFCGTIASPTIRIDTHGGSHPQIGLETAIAMVQDTHAERRDYIRADLVAAMGQTEVVAQAPGEEIETADITCGSSWVCGVVNLLRGTIISQFTSQFQSALAPIQSALAQSSTPDPPGCPTGTHDNGSGKCAYPDGTLVPSLLGTDGTGNFGALLGSVTPGVHALASYVIAAGDHVHGAEVADTHGMTLNLFGAVTSDGHNSCVPRTTAPVMPTIREWTTLRQNFVPGTTPPTPTDLGIGVSEEFMNSALWNLWDSGMFCLGVTTRMSQQLSSGLFGALPQLASLRNVIFPSRNSSIALVLRPQQAPTMRIDTGADIVMHPLMKLTFTQLAIDFYAWSEERYVRFMTVTTDLGIPINLMTDASGSLRPVLGTATTANTVVTNSSMLSAMPAQLAGVLGPLLGTAIGMFAGNVPPINLPSIPLPGAAGASVQIQIPTSGVQGVDESGSRFLGLFANLHYVPPARPATIALDTNATLEMLPFDRTVYQFREGFTEDQLPHVRLRLSTPSDFGHDVEYTYRIDDLTWSAWTRENVVDVTSPSFIGQGAHHVEVRARIVDRADSVDAEPVRLDFTIDAMPPTATVARQGDVLVIDAHDDVQSTDRLQYNVAFDGHASGEWALSPRADIPAGAATYDVRVRDEAGNEFTLHGELTTLTIRGGPSTDAGGGCGCSTPGAPSQNTHGILAAMAAMLFALSLLRRRATRRDDQRVPVTSSSRRRAPMPRFLLWAMVPSFFVALGCNCGAHTITDAGSPDTGPTCDGGMLCGGRCVMNTATCDRVCTSYQTAAGMPTFDPASCTYVANPTTCQCGDNPALPQGMAGSHLDMAVASDNTVWLASYSAGDPRSQRNYGDLVVGTWDRAMSRVNWSHVDGVPTGIDPTSPPSGWRGGVSDAGDDVGRWNSIALDAMGHARVAYWDTTHDHLKFAYHDGTAWHVSVVDATGHNGRYASLVLLTGGIPAIAYRATVPDPMHAGQILGKVRYARAANATPNGPTDWTITDVASAQTQCRAADCATGQVCLSTGLCAATGTGCTAACSAAQACVMGTCQSIFTTGWVEDFPPGIGLFNSLRTDAMGNPQLAYYDRDRGNLMGAHITTGSTWATFIIDGETASGTDISDRGAWATLAVTADGDWHVAYVDGYTEDLHYAVVHNHARMGAVETIDDGAGVGMTPFDDGDHVLGDSAEIDVDTTGAVRVVYQDSTSGTLRMARRAATGWTTSVTDMVNSTGYWSRIEHGQQAVFFRDLSRTTPTFGVRVTAVP